MTEAFDWLETLFADAPEDEWLTTFRSDHDTGKTRTRWFRNTAQGRAKLADVSAKESAEYRRSIWFGVATRHAKLPKGERGGFDDCVTIPGLWLDLDIDGPAHKLPFALPKDEREAIELMARFPLAPSAIIHSGHGLQVWWLFDEPLPVDRDLLDGWAGTWAAIADETGLHVDNVFDAPRIMRLPGTLNHKLEDDTRPCEIVTVDDVRYGSDDLEEAFREPPEPVGFTGTYTPAEMREGKGRPGDGFNEQVPAGLVLQRNGWTFFSKDRNGEHWTRPGKDKRDGKSATVYSDGGTVIWSPAVEGAVVRTKSYDPLGLLALLEHGNDISAASRRLREEGYGDDAKSILAQRYGITKGPRPSTSSSVGKADDRVKGNVSKKAKKTKTEKSRSTLKASDRDSSSTETTQAATAFTSSKTKVPKAKTKRKQSKKKKTKAKKVETVEVKEQPITTLWTRKAPAPLPLDALPHVIAETCVSLGESFQTPPDVPFVFELGLLSLVANESRQRVQIRPGWDDGTNLYLAGVAEPGVGKSPVLKPLMKTIGYVRKQVADDSRAAAVEAADEREIAHAKIKMYKDSIVKMEGGKTDPNAKDLDGRRMLEAAREQLETLGDEINQRTLLADDVTPEAFNWLLHRNGGRLGFISAEGGLLSSGNRYTDNNQLEPLLKGWSGDFVSVTRKTGEVMFEIEDPYVVVALMVQPHIINRFYDDKDAQGTGLASRFMLSYPTSPIGHRKRVGAPQIDRQILQALARLHVGISRLEPTTWPMSKRASRTYLEWVDAIEPDLVAGGSYAPTSDTDIMHHYVSKATASVARVAALLHLAGDEPPKTMGSPIKESTVLNAIKIGEYWLDHAVTMRDNVTPPKHVRLASQIITWSRKKGAIEFAKRDLMKANIGTRREKGQLVRLEADDFEVALQILRVNGWIEERNDEWALRLTAESGDFWNSSALNDRLYGSAKPTIGGVMDKAHRTDDETHICRACRAVARKSIFETTTTLSGNRSGGQRKDRGGARPRDTRDKETSTPNALKGSLS